MKKLKLDVDTLAVESFAADAAPRRTGTVAGYGPFNPTVVPFTENNWPSEFENTCQLECTGTCGYTFCAIDCTHGQTNGATCMCATAMTCAPDPTCAADC